MRSPWWAGDFPVTQNWGPTQVPGEPNDCRWPGCPPVHEGIDIAMPVGTPLIAAVPCILISIGGDPNGYGNDFPYLELGGQRRAILGHCSRTFRGPGRYFAAGETVALSGNEGMSSGPHLHFEVDAYPYGTLHSVNPWPWLDVPPPPPPSEVSDMTPAMVAFGGRLHYFEIGRDRACWHVSTAPGEDFGNAGATSIGGRFISGLAASVSPDGYLCVLGQGDDGYYYRATSADGQNFSEFLKGQGFG